MTHAAARPLRRRLRWLALLLVPLALTLVGLRMGEARRPYWVGANSDPEYPYLLNCLNLAEGHSPVHVDHPGTTLHAFGAIVLHAWHAAGEGGHDPRAAVLREPEAALTAVNYALLAVHAAASLLFGWAVLRAGRNLLLAMIAQAVPALEPSILTGLGRVAPELLIISISLAFASIAMLTITPASADASGPWRPPMRWAILLGIAAGLGLATKVTFAPVAACGLILLPGLRARGAYLLATVAALALAIAPIWRHVPALWDWLWGLATNSGAYGMPGKGVAGLPAGYLPNLEKLILATRHGTAILAVSTLAVLLLRIPALWRRLAPADRLRWRLLAAVTFAGLAQVAIVGKSPHFRHMTAVHALLGVNVVMIASLTVAAFRGRWMQYSVLALGAAALTYAGWRTTGFARRRMLQDDRIAAAGIAIERQGQIQLERGRTLVHVFCSSSPVAALGFGNEWAGRRFGDDLRAAHPDHLHYLTILAPKIRERHAHYSHFGALVPAADVAALAGEGKLALQGPKRFLPPEFKVRPVKLSRPNESGPYGEEGVFIAEPK